MAVPLSPDVAPQGQLSTAFQPSCFIVDKIIQSSQSDIDALTAGEHSSQEVRRRHGTISSHPGTGGHW
ncbi:MAG: hypothetical protein IT508_05835 [Burkholderiaceae bacterium]|nr:hypothetical protein [Burkholderiaceae bacterium]